MIQQTIQEVKFQDIILSKKQRQARKTGKLRHWLEYLNMLDENKSFQKKNQAIKQMHKMFILHQDFWLKEVSRVLNDSANLTIESFQFAFLALEDGFYGKVAQVISQKLFEAYNCQKLRINFVIAKLQILIAQFDHQGNSCSKIFDILLELYFRTNNTKKVRQLFRRKLQLGFDDYDITYDKYNTWENMQKDHTQSVSTTQLLQKARTQWSNHQIFLQEQLPKLQTQGQLQIRAQIFDNKRRIKHCLIYLQNMNTARLHQQKYLQLLELLNNPSEKLWYLRRQALSQTHQMLQSYLESLEISGAEDQDIIAAYRLGLGLDDGLKYEMRYLEYLIRRINKHLSKKQDEDYNEKWGSNVEFFRNEVSELISKQRTNINEQKILVTKYYYLWIQVQTVIVKDSPTVQQIYDSLLAWGATEQIYLSYAKSMIQLNDLPKARFIFNKTCQTYSYSQQIVQEYRKFIQTYGSIEQVTKLKTKLKSLGKTETQMQKLKSKENLVVVKNDIAQQNVKFIRHVNSQVSQDIEKVEQKRIVTQVQVEVNKQVKQVQPQKLTQQPQQNLFKRCSPVQSKQQQPQNNPPKKKPHLDQQNTLFSKNIKPKWTEADIMLNIVFKENVQEVRIVQKENRKFCYIEFDSQENAQKELNSNKSCLQLAFSRPPSKSDNFTLFLCNLPTDTSKTAIKELVPQNYRAFIKDIRSKDKNDKKTAYIQFDDEQTRNQALAQLKKQKIKIGDRTIIAMSCQSDHQNKQKKNRTIFLKNLSFKCKQKDIRKFFQQKNCQTITEVFIPKDEKTNRPKGFAYVQFDSHDEVQKILELQKAKIFDREFTIHRSDRSITHQEPHVNKQSEKTNKPKEASKKSNNFFSNIFS